MESKWSTIRIEDVAKKLAMGPFGSDIKTDNFVSVGIPVIRGNNLTGERFQDADFVYLTNAKADELKAANAFPNDIIFTHRGTLGQVAIIPQNAIYNRYVVSQSQMKLTCDISKVDPSFVFYFFRSPQGQHALLANTSTTGVPAISRPLTSLKQIRIPYPSLPEQRAIARVLGSFDDKIELNRKMNATLEELARTLFKSWFINFDPVHAKAAGRDPAGMDAATAALFPDSFEEAQGRKVPKGWEVKGLDEIATFLNGLALQKYPAKGDDFLPVIKIAQMRKGHTEGSDKASPSIPQAYIIENGDVLFSWSGSLEAMLWYGGRGALNQHLFKVSSDRYPKWFYYLWVLHFLPEFQFIAAGKATTMGHIQRYHLTESKVVVPPSDLIEAANNLLKPLFDELENKNLQSQTLIELQNTLLPKLMSGEIRVRDAERFAEGQL